jgi:RimJ/RimL family protein N-acetyltransferase
MDIRGELVTLRALRMEDAEPIAANASNAEVVRYLDAWAQGPYGVADAREFISASRDVDAVVWAVEEMDGGRCLGTTGLHDIDRRSRHCMWGIALGPPEVWGRGYGTEACRLATAFAFRHLGMEKVCLYVYEPNLRGRRTYEKAGFGVEAVFPRDHWLDGGLVTTYFMSAFCDDPLYRR